MNTLIKDIGTLEEFNLLIKEIGKSFFLFKHSTTCPISARAQENVEVFLKENHGCPVYRILVIESRPLSNHIAEFFSITHQSPQIFLIANKKCVWDASHMAITEVSMKEQLSKVNG